MAVRLNLVLWLTGALLVCCPAAHAQEPARVEEVTIRLELSGGFVGAQTLSQVEEALLETAQLALLDQLGGELDYIRRNQNVVVETLGAVIAQVLNERGFDLEELQIEPARITRLVVRLRLAEQRVLDFAVRFYLLGSTPVVRTVTAEDEEAVAAELYATVARTPYRDEAWLSGLVASTVERQLARMTAYAGFDRQVLVQAGPTTDVAITLTPRAGVEALTDYQLRLRSRTIPFLALQPVRELAAYHLQALIGAPLGFIQAKLPDLRQALYQELVNTCTLANHCADIRLQLELGGCTLSSLVDVDSQRYLLTGEARLALWDYTAGDYEGRLRLRAGLLADPSWAVFGHATYYPGEELVYPAVVVGHLIDYGLVAAGYDFEARQWRLLGEIDLVPQVQLAADLLLDDEFDPLSELVLSYRIRDIYELKLISNLDGEVTAAIAASF
jgi:hypothetical protein